MESWTAGVRLLLLLAVTVAGLLEDKVLEIVVNSGDLEIEGFFSLPNRRIFLVLLGTIFHFLERVKQSTVFSS